ncbi:MAG TPA: M48 family metallopeptidase, partial [Casimicrobium sp.]|nr:M48 family metallopeptidase [Casimicrobium sp.]
MPTETVVNPSSFATTFALTMMVAMLLHYFVERWLLNRHLNCVASWRDQVPAPFAERIELSDHQRAADYTLAKGKLGKVEAAVGLIVSALILFGGLSRMWNFTAPLADMPVLREVALVALLSVVTGVISIPFSYFSTFNIEEKFGFNKTTRAT